MARGMPAWYSPGSVQVPYPAVAAGARSAAETRYLMQQATNQKITIRMILGERAVRTVILVSFVTLAGIGLIAPTLALYARSFGVSYGAAGLLLSAFGLARLASDLFAGPLIDRFGERACATGGLIFLATCSSLTAIAP